MAEGKSNISRWLCGSWAGAHVGQKGQPKKHPDPETRAKETHLDCEIRAKEIHPDPETSTKETHPDPETTANSLDLKPEPKD